MSQQATPNAARNNILGRLRAGAAPTPIGLPDVAAWYTQHRCGDEATAQRVERLRIMMQTVKAELHDTTAEGWPALLLQLARAKGVRNVLIGHPTPHGTALQDWATQHNESDIELRRYEQPIWEWRDALFDEVDASFTLARSAIADIGALVLWPTPEEPRTLSLVPPIHFVLLDVTKLHASFHEAMVAEGWPGGMPTNALLISGPSKTSDIQQTLAYGAHGPRELVVLLCHPSEGAS